MFPLSGAARSDSHSLTTLSDSYPLYRSRRSWCFDFHFWRENLLTLENSPNAKYLLFLNKSAFPELRLSSKITFWTNLLPVFLYFLPCFQSFLLKYIIFIDETHRFSKIYSQNQLKITYFEQHFTESHWFFPPNLSQYRSETNWISLKICRISLKIWINPTLCRIKVKGIE